MLPSYGCVIHPVIITHLSPITYILGLLGAGIEFFRRYIGKPSEKSENNVLVWGEVERRFPLIIAEMKSDFSDPVNKDVRKFFIKSSKTMIGIQPERCFEYHTNVHQNLSAAILYFKELDLIEEITPDNCPMYLFREKFTDYLLK